MFCASQAIDRNITSKSSKLSIHESQHAAYRHVDNRGPSMHCNQDCSLSMGMGLNTKHNDNSENSMLFPHAGAQQVHLHASWSGEICGVENSLECGRQPSLLHQRYREEMTNGVRRMRKNKRTAVGTGTNRQCVRGRPRIDRKAETIVDVSGCNLEFYHKTPVTQAVDQSSFTQ